jgi:hypothetical protein
VATVNAGVIAVDASAKTVNDAGRTNSDATPPRRRENGQRRDLVKGDGGAKDSPRRRENGQRQRENGQQRRENGQNSAWKRSVSRDNSQSRRDNGRQGRDSGQRWRENDTTTA